MTSTQALKEKYLPGLSALDEVRRAGEVLGGNGLILECSGPDAVLGEVCEIYTRHDQLPIKAEVVGFKSGITVLMPYGDVRGVRPGCEVFATGRQASVACDEAMLGRVLDAAGRPVDGGVALLSTKFVPLHGAAPLAIERRRISAVMETGIKLIDCLLPIGVGQRVGIFSGSGVGKSTLLGMLAKNAKCDVFVLAMIGERGREVRDFIEEFMASAREKCIVVVATSDQPAMTRVHAALTATSIAEYFRDRGQSVVLLMDSLTRLAMAQREIGIAAGEPPTVRGYTPSVFSLLPRLVERAGLSSHGRGAITAFYTVLVDGDDMNEPLSDHVRSLLDGHIVLSRDLAQAAQYPPIDPLKSNSRLSRVLLSDAERKSQEDCLGLLALYERSKDMLDFGGYKAGSNPQLDRAVSLFPKIREFLRQSLNDALPRGLAYQKFATILKAV